MSSSQRRYRTCGLCESEKRTCITTPKFTCRPCKKKRGKMLINSQIYENYPSLLCNEVRIIWLLWNKVLSVREISEKLDLSDKTVYRLTSRLCERSILHKTDSLFGCLSRGDKINLNLKWCGFNDQISMLNDKEFRMIRFHSLQGKVNVTGPIRNYEKYRNKNIQFNVGRSKKKKGFNILSNRSMITIYSPKSICITFPDVFIPDISEMGVARGFSIISLLLDETIQRLITLIPGLVIDECTPFDWRCMHIAIKDSVYARRFYERTGHCLKGKRIITDRSHGHHELEAIKCHTAGIDIEECLRMEEEAIKDANSLR